MSAATDEDWARAEAQAEQVRQCIAEVGYADPNLVFVMEGMFGPSVCVSLEVPDDVQWRAAQLTGSSRLCKACFYALRMCVEGDHADDCTGDGWTR